MAASREDSYYLSPQTKMAPCITAAQVVLNFLAQRDTLIDDENVDLILALGSEDISVPVLAAELYHAGKARRVLVAGGIGRLTNGLLCNFKKFLYERGETEHTWIAEAEYQIDPNGDLVIPEARVYELILIILKVPQRDILVEDKSTNSGENIQFASTFLAYRNFNIHSVILIQIPVLQRRAGLTFLKQFPNASNIRIINYAPMFPDVLLMSTEEFFKFSSLAVGEIERLVKYSPPLGDFLVANTIPDNIQEMYLLLKNMNEGRLAM